MHTTVTGIFPNQQLASLAAATLRAAGFRQDQVRVVDATSPDRHEFIARRTRDTKRAVLLGVGLGGLGGAIAGLALASSFGLVQGPLGLGLAGAVGGALLGLWVGRATTSQVQVELEHQVDAGTVLVSVTADSAHENRLLELLAKEGGTSLVSTAASFTAGVLPAAT